MRDKILRVGERETLNGVLTFSDDPNDNELCFLILNSGLMHHVGTSRISVRIARELATQGVHSARFDFSGIGDSAPRRGTSGFSENAQNDVIEVMDELSKVYGIKRFILYGLCSGADTSYLVAQNDDRVIAIAQIDPYLYRNTGWYLRHYLPRLFSLGVWKTVVKKVSKGAASSKLSEPSIIDSADDSRTIPPKSEVEQGYSKLMSNGCKVLVIITGGQLYTFNHEAQFQKIFSNVPWGSSLEYYFFPEAEHILPEPKYQAKVTDTICSWVGSLS